MSEEEFSMWIALADVRNEECPNCGNRADAIGSVYVREIQCIICREKYRTSAPVREPVEGNSDEDVDEKVGP